jgi:hypothetical protein
MDPDACICELFDALANGDVATARERAVNLADWIANGGFEPRPFTIPSGKMREICCTLAVSLPDGE